QYLPRLTLGLEIARESGRRGGDVARLALDCSAQQEGFVSGRAHRLLHGAEHVGGSGCQREGGGGEDRIARLRRLVCGIGERLRVGSRNRKSVTPHDGPRSTPPGSTPPPRPPAPHPPLIPPT